MGQVAINAGVYLLSRLNMGLLAELEAGGLFDLDHVEVKQGIIQPGRRPRSRMFLWRDPQQRHDLIVFVGEAQPPLGKYAFCRQLLGHARQLGVERVFTFAAMATQMHPEHRSRVFGAATDAKGLEELKRLELTILEEGQIGGLNGVLLGVAHEMGLPGVCLLGEMPQIFSQLPFPKASLAILETFTTILGLELDLTELAEQAQASEKQLSELLSQVEKAYQQQFGSEEPEEEARPEVVAEKPETDQIDPAQRQRIEALFEQAARDRSKAYDLKRELDRLGLFKQYEDRFLDLFRKSQ
jgi:proteasome assembly chaperone (PAC2) family protein